MFFSSKERHSSSEYAPLAPHADGEDSTATPENHSSSSLVTSDNISAFVPSKPSQLPKLILYFSFAVALL